MNHCLFSVDGEIQEVFSLDDRGLAYGDGLFETMRCINKDIPLLSLHLKRLLHGCDVLDFAVSQTQIRTIIQKYLSLALVDETDCILKLIVMRGDGGQGYSPPSTEQQSLRFVLSLRSHGYDSFVQNSAEGEVLLGTLASHPMTAGLKHLSRIDYVLAAKDKKRNSSIGLLRNQRGDIVEGLHHNVFFIKNNTVFTPRLIHEGVHGVMRVAVEKVLAASHVELRFEDLNDADIDSADSIFVSNAVSGITPINQIQWLNKRTQHESSTHPIFQSLSKQLPALIASLSEVKR